MITIKLVLGIFPGATSQMLNFPSGNFPKVKLGLLRHCRLQWGPSAAANMREGAEQCGYSTDREVATWKKPLGKYLTS